MITTLDVCKKGHLIQLDHDSKSIIYKNNVVLVDNLIKAYDSGMDKVQLEDNLFFIKINGIIEFGCLEMSEEKFINLRKIVWHLLKKPLKNPF